MRKNKMISIISILALVLITSGAYAWMMKGQVQLNEPLRGSNLIGAEVANTEGETLGEISDIAIDTRNGRVTFAVLSPDASVSSEEKLIAVPLNALTFREDRAVVLNISKEKLVKAPGFEKDQWPYMSNREWAEQTYKFFGVRPYWESGEKEMKEEMRKEKKEMMKGTEERKGKYSY